MHWLRWLVVLLVALLVGAVVAAFLLVRPGLEDGRDHVDARWVPLRPALIARYDALAGIAQALRDAGASDRVVTRDLDAVLLRWGRYAPLGPKHTDPASEVGVANQLEELARRVRANMFASPKLKGNEGLATAFAAFDQAVVPHPGVRSYNRAVRAYEDDRSGAIDRVVADALGYDSRSLLVIGTRA
jgi:hypothetical protein